MLSRSVISDSLWPHGLQLARLLCPWDSPGKNTRVGSHALPPPGDPPNSGIEPRSPTLQADSLSSEPPGKTKNTGVGSLSLPQMIFLTQELNRVSCIAGGFFIRELYQVALSATREAHNQTKWSLFWICLNHHHQPYFSDYNLKNEAILQLILWTNSVTEEKRRKEFLLIFRLAL